MKNQSKTPKKTAIEVLESISDVPVKKRNVSDDEIVGMVREVRKELIKDKKVSSGNDVRR